MACIIRTGNIGIKETFGKFVGVLQPGLNFYLPFISKIHKVNSQINEMPLLFNVRTKNDVFANIELNVQYKINSTNPEKAFYSLRDSKKQIASYVENIIRSKVPKMSLFALYE